MKAAAKVRKNTQVEVYNFIGTGEEFENEAKMIFYCGFRLENSGYYEGKFWAIFVKYV